MLQEYLNFNAQSLSAIFNISYDRAKYLHEAIFEHFVAYMIETEIIGTSFNEAISMALKFADTPHEEIFCLFVVSRFIGEYGR